MTLIGFEDARLVVSPFMTDIFGVMPGLERAGGTTVVELLSDRMVVLTEQSVSLSTECVGGVAGNCRASSVEVPTNDDLTWRSMLWSSPTCGGWLLFICKPSPVSKSVSSSELLPERMSLVLSTLKVMLSLSPAVLPLDSMLAMLTRLTWPWDVSLWLTRFRERGESPPAVGSHSRLTDLPFPKILAAYACSPGTWEFGCVGTGAGSAACPRCCTCTSGNCACRRCSWLTTALKLGLSSPLSLQQLHSSSYLHTYTGGKKYM